MTLVLAAPATEALGMLAHTDATRTRSPLGRGTGATGLIGWLSVLAGLLGACGGSEAREGPAEGLLVIAIDGLRADHVGHLGHDRDTTPTLDALASEGVSFAQAFAAAPRLMPSHVSLLTGCDPNVARRILPKDISAPPERRWRIPEAVPRLAVEMLLAGRATAAFVDHPDLAPLYGFASGFEEYVESGGDATPSGGRLTHRLTQWLRSVDRDRSWFAYLTLQDLERAWSLPRPDCESYFERRRGMTEVPPVGSTDDVFFAIPRSRWRSASRTLGQYEAMYDGHLWCLDKELEGLFGSLRVAGRWENTTIVVVGTHGVQFGEAGLYLRSGRYAMADLHVPCIVRLAPSLRSEEAPRGAVVDQLFSLADLAPTMLDLGSVAIPSGTHGVSHADLLRGAPGASPPREHMIASCGMQEGCAVIGPQHCLEYLLPGQAEVLSLGRSWFGREVDQEDLVVRFYDRLEDAHPPLAGEPDMGHPDAKALHARALAWFENISLARSVLQAKPALLETFDPAELERLCELGYLSTSFEPEG